MTEKPTHEFRILVIDDDREMRDSLDQLLTSSGWQVHTLRRATEVAQHLSGWAPDVILSDLRMPGMSGIELLQSLSGENAPPVVLVSAHGDIPRAVEAMQLGAYSFLEKPFDPRRLLSVLQHAAEQRRLQQETARLKDRLANLSGLDRVLLGESNEIRRLREDIIGLSDLSATVMLLGETGTGKELVARALHDLSPRSARPFVAVNCAAITEDHFEATMFGAADGPAGIFASASGGTLFLDEIGAIPLLSQAKLLRAIETGEYLPVGAGRAETADVRILSASNTALNEAVANGKFREDLFFRLNPVIVTLPPLRDRNGDIPLLFTHFRDVLAATYETRPPETTAEDIAALLSHDWPGNVRELRHVAERRVLAARRGGGSVAQAISLQAPDEQAALTLREAVAGFERQLISRALQSCEGRMDEVAEALGIGRRTLNDKIVKLGLDKDALL